MEKAPSTHAELMEKEAEISFIERMITHLETELSSTRKLLATKLDRIVTLNNDGDPLLVIDEMNELNLTVEYLYSVLLDKERLIESLNIYVLSIYMAINLRLYLSPEVKKAIIEAIPDGLKHNFSTHDLDITKLF